MDGKFTRILLIVYIKYPPSFNPTITEGLEIPIEP